MTGTLNEPLASVDADVARAIDHELGRQQSTLEMIASENFALHRSWRRRARS